MAQFTAEVFQNEFLPDGGTDVHAIVTVTCSGAGEAGRGESGDAAEVIIVDVSASMAYDKFHAAQAAAALAVDQILDGTWFAIIAGTDRADRAFPYPNAPRSMVRMDASSRAAAKDAIQRMIVGGGTAIGSWLRLAQATFEAVPEAQQRHAILLTDGRNQSETAATFQSAVAAVAGRFECDARGVGADWEVAELRTVAQALMGTVDLVRDESGLAADFQAIMAKAMSKGVPAADLRVWAPQGAQVLFVKQVSPTVDDLTPLRQPVNPLTGAFPTGSWGDESRDYHVAVRLGAKAIGAEQLAARVQLAVGGEVQAQGLVKALWTDDDTLTTRIDAAVAHYTGQAELAEAIQEGLAAKAGGDDRTATVKLARAVQLAHETGNDEATAKLRKVVDIDNAETGTVRLKRNVEKLDEMELDTASTKTTRVRR